jgi:hypothetical protein
MTDGMIRPTSLSQQDAVGGVLAIIPEPEAYRRERFTDRDCYDQRTADHLGRRLGLARACEAE